MKLVLISDTHGYTPDLPDGDILLHGGDLTGNGSVRECQEALDWLNAQSHKHVVAIAGNHDFAFETSAKKAQLDIGRIVYLENTGVEIEGLKIYGSPVQPEFCDWAFNVSRGEAIRRYWNLIPNDLDILITHGPPKGILDQSRPTGVHSEHLGCEELALAVERTKPRLHMFGHIHGGHGYKNFNGTEFFNCSMVTEGYRLGPTPFEVDFETKDEVVASISAENERIERT